MNLALSDEQVFLREAARGALSRFKTLEAAREALDGKDALPDLWPMAKEAGWPGLLIDEAHGGAGLDARADEHAGLELLIARGLEVGDLAGVIGVAGVGDVVASDLERGLRDREGRFADL